MAEISYVALMDSRSIAATARNGGVLTAADELEHVPRAVMQPFFVSSRLMGMEPG